MERQLERRRCRRGTRAVLSSRSARRARTAATTPARSSSTSAAIACGARRENYDPVQTEVINERIAQRVRRRNSWREHAGRGHPGPRANLRRRPAALRLDADRADPRQPLRGRRDARTARGRAAHPADQPRAKGQDHLPRGGARLRRRSLGRTRPRPTSTRPGKYRRGAPHFIDKMPNNFASIGLLP